MPQCHPRAVRSLYRLSASLLVLAGSAAVHAAEPPAPSRAGVLAVESTSAMLPAPTVAEIAALARPVALCSIAQQPIAAVAPRADATATAPATGNGSSGFVASIDPETGELRAPTPADLESLRAQSDSRLVFERRAEPQVEVRADGMLSLVLNQDYMDYAVAKVGSDGELQFRCVKGLDRAEAALQVPAVDPHPALEEK